MRTIAFSIFMFATLIATAEQSLLECKFTSLTIQHIKFDPKETSALLIWNERLVKGTVDATDTVYRFNFPVERYPMDGMTSNYVEINIVVNRYSGKARFQFGDPLDDPGEVQLGVCTKEAVEPKL